MHTPSMECVCLSRSLPNRETASTQALLRATYLEGVHKRAGYKDRGEHVLQADKVPVTSGAAKDHKKRKTSRTRTHEAEGCKNQRSNGSAKQSDTVVVNIFDKRQMTP